MIEGLTLFERALLDKLLSGADKRLAALRAQASAARLVSKDYTGAGFYCEIEVAPSAPRVSTTPNFELGDVDITMDGLKYGAGALVFIRDGVMTALEGYSYEEPWPSEVKNFSLAYRSSRRQLPAEPSP